MVPNSKDGNVPFETALDRAGFGCYSYLMSVLTGLIVIAFASIVYSSTIIIPASACELETTSAQQGFLAAAPVVGAIVGTPLWGYMADIKGRRKVLLLSLILGAVVNAITSISVNWIMLMVMQFLAATTVAGLFPVAMTLLSESVPMAKRNLVVILVTSIFLMAQGLMAVIAIPVIPLTFLYHLPALGIYWNSWRTLLVVYSIPSLVCLCWMYFMKESPKFIFMKESEDKAIEVLKTIHRINNKRGEILEVSGLIPPEEDNEAPVSAKERMKPLFKLPLLKPFLILITLNLFQLNAPFMVWLPSIANQFLSILESGEGSDLTLCGVIDLSFNTPADPDAVPCAVNVTALLTVLIVGALQSLTNIVMSLVVNKVGRRNLVMIITVFCGTSGILVNLMPNAYASAALFIVQMIGLITVGLYTALAVSLFPTNLRAVAVAFIMTGSRVGSFANIQLLNYLRENYCEVGFYVFSSVFASSALVAALLPDDRRLSSPPVAPSPLKKEDEATLPRGSDVANTQI